MYFTKILEVVGAYILRLKAAVKAKSFIWQVYFLKKSLVS
jgi:hypothetical protein